MARNLLQDMVKVRNNSSLQVAGKKEKIFQKPEPKKELELESELGQNKKGSKYRIYFVALISVLFLLFALSYLFSGAKITIKPKVEDIPINEKLTALKDSNVSDLSFDLVVISGEENKIVEGGEEKDVAIKATGTVLIYNSFSSLPQNLDIDTRLEGSNGKIYKTVKKITVPGMTGDKPGSVEVGIYGAEAGEAYNSVPLDFKIFGFKGTPKYEKFYARSRGDITGGFKGKSPIVSSLDKASVISELSSTLETKLVKKITDQIPSGFVLFKDAVFLKINDKDVSFTLNKENKTVANVKGTLYGFLFDEKKLTKKIAKDIIEEYNGDEVYMPNIRELTFSLNDKENISFADTKNINFSITGTPEIIWKIDEVKFASDIIGKKKEDFNKILSQYPNIDSAELVIRPFWKSSFPETTKNIEIIVNYPR